MTSDWTPQCWQSAQGGQSSTSGSSKGQILPKDRQTRRQGGSHSQQDRDLTSQGSAPQDLSRAGSEITGSPTKASRSCRSYEAGPKTNHRVSSRVGARLRSSDHKAGPRSH